MGVVIKRSTGERAQEISAKRGIPYVTVETIIKDYLSSLKDSAKQGERIVLDGITSISIIYDEESGDYIPRGRVSTALKSSLKAEGIDPNCERLQFENAVLSE